MAKPVSLWRRSLVAGFFSFLLVASVLFMSWKPMRALEAAPTLAFSAFCLPILTLANLLRVPGLWRQYRFKAFVPFLICAFGLFLAVCGLELGRWLHMREFKANLPQYEAVVDDIAHRRAPPAPTGIVMERKEDCCYIVRFPPEKKYLGYWARAEFGEDGVLTVRFILSTSIDFHHRMFMYRSDGDFEKAYRERERGAPINEHWAAVSD